MIAGRIHGIRVWAIEFRGGSASLHGVTGRRWVPGGRPTVAQCSYGNTGSGAPRSPPCARPRLRLRPLRGPPARRADRALLSRRRVGPAGGGRRNRRGVGAGRGARGGVPGPVRAADRDRRRRGSARTATPARILGPGRSPVPRRAGRGRRPSRPRRLLPRPWPRAVARRSFARWSRSSHALAQQPTPEQHRRRVGGPRLGDGGLGSASGLAAMGLLGAGRRSSGTASSHSSRCRSLIAVINGDFGSSGERSRSASCASIEQALVRYGDELRYIAVVRNTSEKRVALAAFARGRVLDRDGDRVVRAWRTRQGRLATDAAAGRDRGRGRRAARSRAPRPCPSGCDSEPTSSPGASRREVRSPRSRSAIRRSTAVGADSASRWRRAGRLAGPGSRSSPATPRARSAARGRWRLVTPRSSAGGRSSPLGEPGDCPGWLRAVETYPFIFPAHAAGAG